ncbi:MAG TPA: hypothetical protein VGE88_11590 [Lysobacter sp.]
MTHDTSTESSLQVEIAPHAPGLRVRVHGAETLENAVSYWHAILLAVHETGATAVLLVDELHGGPLSEAQWLELVVRTDPEQMRRLKIAHVKPRGLQEVEYCELYARAHEIDARVFVDVVAAEKWLRESGD